MHDTNTIAEVPGRIRSGAKRAAKMLAEGKEPYCSDMVQAERHGLLTPEVAAYLRNTRNQNRENR